MNQVSLQEITFDTVRSVTSLEVSPKQRTYVAPNAVSISEAHFNPGAWFRAIYADKTPVGFVMLFDPTVSGAIARGPIAKDEVGLWRFMIDHRFQRKGLGKKALDLVCEHVRRANDANRLLSSYVPGPDGPESFYLSYGFSKTAHLRGNGHEIEIALRLRN
jgi:diamine N-acetyltransferase